MLAVMVPKMMEMKRVIRTHFRNGSTRQVPMILSQNYNGKRRSGSIVLSVTSEKKVREVLAKHLSLISADYKIPLL